MSGRVVARRYLGAFVLAALIIVGLSVLYLVLDFAAVSSTNVHVFGTFLVLAIAGVVAWVVHAEWNAS